MSFKAKNLTVNAEEPAFLKRLRGEVGEAGDRHSHAVARPRRLRDADDADDGPTYVDADTNDPLSQAQIDELTGKKPEAADSAREEPLPADGEGNEAEPVAKGSKKELVGVIGGAGKRRIAKVVGDADESANEKAAECDADKAKKRKKASSKKTKVKLSFGDD